MVVDSKQKFLYGTVPEWMTSTMVFFTITAGILARSLANFHCQIRGRTHEFIINAILLQARTKPIL